MGTVWPNLRGLPHDDASGIIVNLMSATRKSKQEVVSEFRTRGILDAARKVFAKKGYAHATMDEIATVTGLSKGTLYLYFESKQDVYLKALRSGSAEMLKRTKIEMQNADGIRAKIRALIATSVKCADENRDFNRIYAAELSNVIHPSSIDADLRDSHTREVRVIEKALRDAIDTGEIQPLDVEEAAFTIQDMARSLITRRLLGWSKKNGEHDIDFLCSLIWKGIG